MASSPRSQRADDLRRRLADLSAELLRTEDELASLECEGRLALGETPSPLKIPQTPAEKVTLFLDLFGTRRSVYPRRWENGKTGKSGYGRRLLEIDGQIALGRRGRVKIVAPFQMEIGPEAAVVPVPIEQVKHPIHRATNWEVELERGISVRALALKENVSASLVSFHLKLLRLAPEIQIFVRGLSTPAEVEFFSLRKLALLSELDRETQLARFKTWQRRFSTITTPNAPAPLRHESPKPPTRPDDNVGSAKGTLFA